jgi:hypothetical protein
MNLDEPKENLKVPQEHQEYFFFGMKRSGNHCVINWICQHFDSYIHYNNCFISNNKIYVNFEEEIIKKGKEPYQIKLISFEDRPEIINNKFNSRIEKVLEIEHKKIIILLRDAYNTYASRYMKKQNPKKGLESWNYFWTNYNDQNLWIDQAKKYLNRDSNQININFNNWFLYKNYREKISQIFGRDHTDAGLDIVPHQGAGSSFDGLKYNKNAQKMNILKRYKYFLKDKNFIENIVLNKEIKDLNKKIFNFFVEQKIYL